MAEVTAAVGSIKQRTLDAGQRVIDAQSLRFVQQVLARLPKVDSRLQEIADELTAAQGDVRAFHRDVNRWIVLAAVGGTVLFSWMGLGQFALCRWGWSGERPLSATALVAGKNHVPKAH